MPKIFYTERDIEDLAGRGIFQIEVNDDVVLTEIAFEKADKLGVALIQSHQKPPSAPERPYLSAFAEGKGTNQLITSPGSSDSARVAALKYRVKTAAQERLGSKVDPALLDKIIDRVIRNIGVS